MADFDYYEILGVSKNATDKEIKSAFRKKAAAFHPDKNKDPKAPEEFKKINEAYQVLSDPEKRKMYDQFGASAFENGGGFNNQGFGGAGFDFSDFFGGGFESIFGENNPFGDIFGGRTSARQSNRGEDISVRIKVTLEDIIKGPEKEIQYNRKVQCKVCQGKGGSKVETCKTCNGSGRVAQVTRSLLGNMRIMRECPECRGTGKKILEKCSVCHGESVVSETKNLKIRIPGGIESGMNLRFREEGNAGIFGGEYGDLFVEIVVEKDNRFMRQGDNLLMKLNLPIYSLILGDEVDILTFDGQKRVKIPAGIQVGEKLALKELGIPNRITKKRGDIILDISVEVPKKINQKEKELFEELKEIDKNKGKGFFG